MSQNYWNARARHGVACWAGMVSFFGVIGGVLYWSLSVTM